MNSIDKSGRLVNTAAGSLPVAFAPAKSKCIEVSEASDDHASLD